jgi:long-chain acyl-CoA synthetase
MLHRPPLHYPEQPLHQFLADAADRHPERIAVVFEGENYTFRELDGAGNAFANALPGMGFRPGHRVALVVSNRPEWIIAQHGVSQAGGAVVMPNPSWEVGELRHAFELTEPDIVIAEAQFADLVDEAGGPARRVCVDRDVPEGWLSFWDLVYGSSGQRPAPPPGFSLDDDVALPFSSGTTGLPKAVRHTHRSLVAACITWNSAATIGEDDHIQFFLPLFHIYGIVTLGCSFHAASKLTLLPRFELDRVLTNIQDDGITLAFGAAPIAVAMANHPDLERYDLSSLRYFLWAATPVAEDVAHRVTERTGIRWVQAYGCTEGHDLYCNPIHRPDQCRLDSPGLPISDLEVRIVDLETHEDLPLGEHGELVVRGPHLMAGYLPAEANADAFLDGGWLRTGDVGWLEPDGWLHLTDRAKEMIKSSAFAVAPAELEATLHAHPAVADVGVYGVPDERRGEAPKAAVVLTAPGAATAEELSAWVAERLATYKHIDQFVFVDEIPRTTSGKVLRRTLKEIDPDLAGA